MHQLLHASSCQLRQNIKKLGCRIGSNKTTHPAANHHLYCLKLKLLLQSTLDQPSKSPEARQLEVQKCAKQFVQDPGYSSGPGDKSDKSGTVPDILGHMEPMNAPQSKSQKGYFVYTHFLYTHGSYFGLKMTPHFVQCSFMHNLHIPFYNISTCRYQAYIHCKRAGCISKTRSIVPKRVQRSSRNLHSDTEGDPLVTTTAQSPHHLRFSKDIDVLSGVDPDLVCLCHRGYNHYAGKLVSRAFSK